MGGRFFLALVCGCALAACAKAVPMPQHAGRLTIAILGEPFSLNPLYLQDGAASMIGELGRSYRTNYDAHGKIVTDVAVIVPMLANGGISAMETHHLSPAPRRPAAIWPPFSPPATSSLPIAQS